MSEPAPSLDELLDRLAVVLRDRYGLVPECVVGVDDRGERRTWPFPRAAAGGPPLTPCERAVLAAVRAEPGLFAEQLHAAVNPAPPRENFSLRSVHRALAVLKKHGLVDNPRRGAGYVPPGK